jgi:hypothetical protein
MSGLVAIFFALVEFRDPAAQLKVLLVVERLS